MSGNFQISLLHLLNLFFLRIAYVLSNALTFTFFYLIYYQPEDVRKLWDIYCDALSEDYKRTHRNSSVEEVLSLTLKSINFYLESMGKSVKDYDLPTLKGISLEQELTLPKEIADELSIKVTLEDLETQSKLNPEQEEAFKEMIEKVDSNSSGVFFIDGPGGTGKTYLYKALLANVRSRGMIGLATATCGVAAAIMSGGCTAHSRFGIPIDVHESSESNYSKQEPKAQLIKRARLILWDEAPMAKRCAIEMVDRFLRDIMNNNELFSGKVVVFGGDFR